MHEKRRLRFFDSNPPVGGGYLDEKEKMFAKLVKEDRALSPEKLLDNLIEGQVAEIEQNDLLYLKDKNPQTHYFDAYLGSRPCLETIAELQALQAEGYHDPFPDLKGRVFSDLAFAHLLAKVYPGAVVLSNERADRLYAYLFPDAEVISNPFTIGLDGITVPDNLVVPLSGSAHKVPILVEHTTVRTIGKFDEKFDAFKASIDSLYKRGVSGRRLFPRRPRVLYLTPEFDDPNVFDGFKVLHGGTDHESVLTDRAINALVNRVIAAAQRI